jgi:hypothetical protein
MYASARKMKVSSKALPVNNTRLHAGLAAHRGKPPIRVDRGTITTRRRFDGSPNRARPAATVGCIVRYHDAPTDARRHTVIALLVLLVVLIAGTGWKLTEHNALAHHGPHALPSNISSDFAAVVGHPHVQDDSTPMAPDAFAEAALPRMATLLVALGLVAVIGAAFAYWATGASTVIRGPPRWCAFVVTGQQLLVRLCIARR